MSRLFKNNIVLYHGTTLSSLEQIFKDRHILTRKSLHKQANLEVYSVIQDNAVYFSSDENYCKMFAEKDAMKNNDTPIVIYIVINERTHKLLPDEDIIQYFWYGNDSNDLESIAKDFFNIKDKNIVSHSGKHRFNYSNDVDSNNYKNYAYTINDNQYKNLNIWMNTLINNSYLNEEKQEFNFSNVDILKNKELKKLFNETFSYKDSLRDIFSLAVIGNVSISYIKKINVGIKNNNNDYDYYIFDKSQLNLMHEKINNI